MSAARWARGAVAAAATCLLVLGTLAARTAARAGETHVHDAATSHAHEASPPSAHAAQTPHAHEGSSAHAPDATAAHAHDATPAHAHDATSAHAHDAASPHAHGTSSADSAAPASPPAARRLYTCGMHPQVIRDQPGSCPICGMELTPIERGAPAVVGEATDTITIDPAIVQNMGVRTAEVTVGPLVRTVRATGVLAEAQPRQHDVSLRVSGWIEKLYADVEGMEVRAGDPLFELYSPELHVAIGELIAARRARGMQGGASLVATATQKLELLGVPRAEIERLARLAEPPRTVTFRSPISGHVVEKPIVEGDAVEAGTRALRIVDHSELWLDVRVFEQDVPALRLGQRARVTFVSRPGRTIEGTIDFVYPHVDPKTRTTVARMTLRNPGMQMRPGMYATVEIESELAPWALLAPREAVIDTGDEQLVFLARPGGHFEPRRVTLGPSGRDGQVQVLDGLAAGDVVVTSGQFLLDAESNVREALQRFLGAPGHVH
ncbi:MAG TPA: efflux RND transporter periplasmic adaptor subunit [Candidatus Binatia bacterium]